MQVSVSFETEAQNENWPFLVIFCILSGFGPALITIIYIFSYYVAELNCIIDITLV